MTMKILDDEGVEGIQQGVGYLSGRVAQNPSNSCRMGPYQSRHLRIDLEIGGEDIYLVCCWGHLLRAARKNQSCGGPCSFQLVTLADCKQSRVETPCTWGPCHRDGLSWWDVGHRYAWHLHPWERLLVWRNPHRLGPRLGSASLRVGLRVVEESSNLDLQGAIDHCFH